MNSKKKIAILSITVLAFTAVIGAAVLGAAFYRSVRADATRLDTVRTFESGVTANTNGFAPNGRGRGPAGGYTPADLAAALGITEDELTAAQEDANAAALVQAVEEGLITQAQADEITKKGSAFPFGGHWDGWLSQSGIEYNALLADALGITTDELQAAYTQAFEVRIDQAVTDGNLTQEQADLMKGERALYSDETFQSSMQSAFESAVNSAVSSGVITQAQADQILSKVNAFPGGGMGFPAQRGFDGHGGFEDMGRPGHGGMFTPPDADSSTDTETATP